MCEGMTIHAIGDKASGHKAESSNHCGEEASLLQGGPPMVNPQTHHLKDSRLLMRSRDAFVRYQWFRYQ